MRVELEGVSELMGVLAFIGGTKSLVMHYFLRSLLAEDF